MLIENGSMYERQTIDLSPESSIQQPQKLKKNCPGKKPIYLRGDTIYFMVDW